MTRRESSRTDKISRYVARALYAIIALVSMDRLLTDRTFSLSSHRTRANALTFANIGERGRLGNQLFQIATTIGVAERHGLSWGFPVKIAETSAGKLFELRGNPEFDRTPAVVHEEHQMLFYNITLPNVSDGQLISLFGYFQSPKYFEKSSAAVAQYLMIPTHLIKRVKRAVPELGFQNVVAIHIRRADYVELIELYGVLRMDYYIEALKAIGGVDALIVTSDDIEWCRRNLKLGATQRVVFSPFNDEIMDFIVLYMARHVIIANSTFSWWAAYLKHLHSFRLGKVVAPFLRYNETGGLAYLNQVNIYPASWIRL